MPFQFDNSTFCFQIFYLFRKLLVLFCKCLNTFSKFTQVSSLARTRPQLSRRWKKKFMKHLFFIKFDAKFNIENRILTNFIQNSYQIGWILNFSSHREFALLGRWHWIWGRSEKGRRQEKEEVNALSRTNTRHALFVMTNVFVLIHYESWRVFKPANLYIQAKVMRAQEDQTRFMSKLFQIMLHEVF